MPRPPPPAEALTNNGNPIAPADRVSSSSATPPATTTLGKTGTPAADTVSLARTLWPMTRIDSGVGPTQTRPARAHASGSSGFSERNPYPGWMASAPASPASATSASGLR